LDTVEALKLTEDTMKLATLAGLDFKDATSQMTAALRAFHMEMDQGAHVTDVYAEIAAHAAVDVKGLSEAMSACAAIANSAGMSFENTSAMLATMVEATQEAPKNLGTAMKTILARFTELKNDVAGTAESEFEDLDYNKVDKALKSVGISIKDASGQFRNMDEVLLELSGKWNTLDRNS
jgi:TP901 family phage tail tape measure protein